MSVQPELPVQGSLSLLGYTTDIPPSQHFQKMKRESIKGDGSAKRKSKPGTPKTPSRKRKQLNGDAEDDELTSTPSKIKKMKEEEEGVEPAVVHKIKDDDVKDDKLEEYSSDK